MDDRSMESSHQCDVLVIGGGIHGVGVAQAAAAAGYSVIVLEKTGLASGTSSKSSKLIHGGLRYLETFDISLVRESLKERELLLDLAPSLVRRQPFLIPVYPSTTRSSWKLRVGLAGYWALAGWKKYTGFGKIPRRRWAELDGLRTDGLRAVWQYWDAQTNDRLLTQAVMQSAQALGAELHCPAHLVHATLRDQSVIARVSTGQQSRDTSHYTIEAKVAVNASGPWATQVASCFTPAAPAPKVDLVQGTHIECPGALAEGCYYVEAPQDKRAVFVMPWEDRTMVGTTELLHEAAPEDSSATDEEVQYLVDVYRHFFPNRSADVLDSWAGLRVLPASEESANRRSRETQLPVDRAHCPRVISVFGGKLTGYRATAEKVIETIRDSLPMRTRKARTDRLPLEVPN